MLHLFSKARICKKKKCENVSHWQHFAIQRPTNVAIQTVIYTATAIAAKRIKGSSSRSKMLF